MTPCDLNNHVFCYGDPDTLTFECACDCHEDDE